MPGGLMMVTLKMLKRPLALTAGFLIFGGLSGPTLAKDCGAGPPLYGAIGNFYKLSGGSDVIGCPISDEHPIAPTDPLRGRIQSFEWGEITWFNGPGYGGGFVVAAYAAHPPVRSARPPTTGPITVKWSGGLTFGSFLARLDRNGQTIDQVEYPGGTAGTTTFRVTAPGSYDAVVQGCNTGFNQDRACAPWSGAVHLTLLGRPGTVAVAAAAAGMDAGYDRPGLNIASFPLAAANPNLCRERCDARGDCAAWAYVNPGLRGIAATCFLKNAVPRRVKNSCCVSGVKSRLRIGLGGAPTVTQ